MAFIKNFKITVSLLFLMLLFAGCGPTDSSNNSPAVNNAALTAAEWFNNLPGTNLNTAGSNLVEAKLLQRLDGDSLTNMRRLLAVVSGGNLDSLPSGYSVAVYKITYLTAGFNNKTDTASGLLAVPSKDSAAVWIIMHPTITKDEQAPSAMGMPSYLLTALTAGAGNVILMPDYLGLGVNKNIYPYLIKDVSSRVSYDFASAVKQFLSETRYPVMNNIMITGYSEGGYTSLALAEYWQSQSAPPFRAAGIFAGAGPYHLTETFSRIRKDLNSYPMKALLPLVMFTYDSVYNVYDDIKKLFHSSIQDSLSGWIFSGKYSLSQINNRINQYAPKDSLFAEGLSAEALQDSLDRLTAYFEQNEPIRFNSAIPIQFFHCEGDDWVGSFNALNAADSLKKYGSAKVITNIQPAGGHDACMFPAFESAFMTGASWMISPP